MQLFAMHFRVWQAASISAKCSYQLKLYHKDYILLDNVLELLHNINQYFNYVTTHAKLHNNLCMHHADSNYWSSEN